MGCNFEISSSKFKYLSSIICFQSNLCIRNQNFFKSVFIMFQTWVIICTCTLILCIMYYYELNLISHRLLFSSNNVSFFSISLKRKQYPIMRSLFGLYDLCFLRMEVGNKTNKSDSWIEISCYHRECTRK